LCCQDGHWVIAWEIACVMCISNCLFLVHILLIFVGRCCQIFYCYFFKKNMILPWSGLAICFLSLVYHYSTTFLLWFQYIAAVLIGYTKLFCSFIQVTHAVNPI
jgi:hypothetical protein